MKKPRFKNLFFIISILIIMINYILLGISYYIQNNIEGKVGNSIFNLGGLEAWNIAISISEISLLVIILSLVLRIIFIFIRKLNLSEFLIGAFLNIIAFYSCLMVIADRI